MAEHSPVGNAAGVAHPPITTFVHQRNRLTEGQQGAWDRWWPEHGRDIADLLSGALPYDPAAWFGRTAPLVLEIGTGMGETTAALAAAAPDIDHLGAEVFEPGLAQLLTRVVEDGLTNLALLRGDAVELLRTRVPEGSLDGIRIYFPDPWPKRKHRKRRLVQPAFVAMAVTRLRPGGTLHMATDWDDYAVQMRSVADGEPLLENTSADPEGWTPRPPWRPVTKFEQRAHLEGRDVHDLLYRRSYPNST
ncbi:tRNA (guanosine(46)-N7)-methyltransferase TrmB [Pseudonocardia sp. GCM10023141]|uniref:tRNA (guanosine(46)-N7)-methyltransferase TrmB n=1 Tax=Pseudonocardia sp. GCM10023141 TaxID=3252653 RepID=UPI00360BECF6